MLPYLAQTHFQPKIIKKELQHGENHLAKPALLCPTSYVNDFMAVCVRTGRLLLSETQAFRRWSRQWIPSAADPCDSLFHKCANRGGAHASAAVPFCWQHRYC